MRNTHSNYLRTHRRKCGLTQQETAFLLGLDSGHTISRYERHARVPTLQTALACQVIFDVGPRELFPSLYRKIEKQTLRRICLLTQRLDAQANSLVVIRKQDVLKQAIERSGSDAPHV